MVYTFAYGVLLLDVFVVPCLMWKRTYRYACAAALAFHLINSQLFSIGIFPWFMIAATLVLFYPYRWPQLPRHWREGVRKAVSKPASLTRLQQATVYALSVYVVVQIAMPLRHLL